MKRRSIFKFLAGIPFIGAAFAKSVPVERYNVTTLDLHTMREIVRKVFPTKAEAVDYVRNLQTVPVLLDVNLDEHNPDKYGLAIKHKDLDEFYVGTFGFMFRTSDAAWWFLFNMKINGEHVIRPCFSNGKESNYNAYVLQPINASVMYRSEDLVGKMFNCPGGVVYSSPKVVS